MSESWTLPGHDVQVLLGFGATGEVWRARDQVTGEQVVLRRLREGLEAGELARLRQQGPLLSALDSPYLLRLRAVLDTDGGTVVVADHVDGGSLAALLSRRRTLRAGEVVTLAAPVASALAVVHAAGLVHGRVCPSSVLLTTQGMPQLADLGLAGLTGVHGPQPSPPDDVAALAGLCHLLLAGVLPEPEPTRLPLSLLAPAAPATLVAAVEAGLADDPPTAAAFAVLLRQAATAEPVRLRGPALLPAVAPWPSAANDVSAPPAAAAPSVPPPPAPLPPRRSGSRDRARPHRRAPARPAWLGQRVLVPVAVLLVMVLGAAVGWRSGRSPEAVAAVVVANLPAPAGSSPGAAANSPAAPTRAELLAVLEELDQARSAAFAAADYAGLLQVHTLRSDSYQADAALIAGLAAQGRTAWGVRHTIRSLQVVSADSGRARVHVVDALSAYEVRGADGTVQRAPAPGASRHVVDLVRTSSGWRLTAVTAA